MTSRLRISAIRFLNPAPLMWDFEHDPEKQRLAERYQIHSTMPSQCAEELATGRADIGLIPVAAYATTPGLAVIPGCAIASLDRVRSILLVVRHPDGIGAVRRVAADTASRSSNAYAQIILRKFYGVAPEFVPHAPDTDGRLDTMLTDCDAAVLIGDPALRAIEDRAARAQRTGEQLTYIDLAQEWKQHTGLPWVSAFWAVRSQAIQDSGLNAAEINADFQRSRDHGMAHIEDLVAEWTPRMIGPPAVQAATIRTYLSHNIHYMLDDDCLAGLGLFYRYAAELGVLPAAPPLRLL
ncbi:MAG TPA: menaquinone biosynthesis protein [Acidobacteriaceae bacterium]|nr:menaquinone biosynthesis protein [Acidobacteriaceae bacterium]